jgi:hypothetical protein
MKTYRIESFSFNYLPSLHQATKHIFRKTINQNESRFSGAHSQFVEQATYHASSQHHHGGSVIIFSGIFNLMVIASFCN